MTSMRGGIGFVYQVHEKLCTEHGNMMPTNMKSMRKVKDLCTKSNEIYEQNKSIEYQQKPKAMRGIALCTKSMKIYAQSV